MSLETVTAARNELRSQLVLAPGIFEGKPPSTWFRPTYRAVREVQRSLPGMMPETQEHLGPLAEKAIAMLTNETSALRPDSEEGIAMRAEALIMSLSFDMAQEFAYEVPPIPERFISIDELVSSHPDQLRISKELRHGQEFTLLGLKNPLTNIWYDVPLPTDKKMWHKGGVARAVLDIHAGAPVEMLASELPWNDLDVITSHDEETAHRHADLLGVDPQGIEIVQDLDYGKFFAGRDTTQNMVALGSDGIYYTDSAYLAAQTGHIEISSAFFPDKAIYNTDRFLYKDPETGEAIILPKQRGMMRLIKAVAEGKAISFDHRDISANLDFGIYSLFLLKRWMRKPNFGELSIKMFELLRQTGQTLPEETTIMDYLERVHPEYAFFNFDRDISTVAEVTAWKAKKLIKQIDREFGWRFNHPPTIEFMRKPGDTEPRRISLEGFTVDPIRMQEFLEWWPGFLERARRGVDLYVSDPPSLVQKYFYGTDAETQMNS